MAQTPERRQLRDLFTDTERQQLRDLIVETLNDEGCQPGSSMHSWRCEDKGRYPEPCTCVAEAADQILVAVSWSAVGPAVVARIRDDMRRECNQKWIAQMSTLVSSILAADPTPTEEQLDQFATDNLIHADLREILQALGLGEHARNCSPHEVVQREVLPAIRSLAGPTPTEET